MANEARKYIMSCSERISSGITMVDLDNETYDLTEAFSGYSDSVLGEIYSYVNITISELGLLTDVQYNQRVLHFLMFINVNSISRRTELLSESTYIEETCPA